MAKDFLWVESYRPTRIEDCVLPTELKKVFTNIVKTGEMHNMLLTGTPGLGKSSVARALCKTLDLDWIQINGSEEGGIDILRNKIKQFASTVSLGGGYKVVIIDEADYLNCFTAEQEILYSFTDSVNDISSCSLNDLIGKEFFAKSVNPKTLEETLTPAYIIERGDAEVFEVEFTDGTTMECTKDHVFFSNYGEELKIELGLGLLNV